MTNILQELIDVAIFIFAFACFIYLRRKRASKLEWIATVISIAGLLLVNPGADFIWKARNGSDLWKLCVAVWALVLLGAAMGFYKARAIRVFPLFAIGHSIIMADVALIVYLKLRVFYLLLSIGMAFILACIPLARLKGRSISSGRT